MVTIHKIYVLKVFLIKSGSGLFLQFGLVGASWLLIYILDFNKRGKNDVVINLLQYMSISEIQHTGTVISWTLNCRNLHKKDLPAGLVLDDFGATTLITMHQSTSD